MNNQLIKEVEEQMEIADQLYMDNIENIDLDRLLVSSIAIKKAKAHMMGTIIEQYLKALIIWKGSSWKEVKKMSHGLLELYKVLDEEGKRILLKMFNVKPKRIIIRKIVDPDIYDNDSLFSKKGKFTSYLPAGTYDGDCDFPKQLDENDFDCSYFESLLERVNIPSLRYSSSSYDLTNRDLVNLLDFTRNMHVLSKIARGVKKQPNKR